MAIRTSYIKCHRADKTSTFKGGLDVSGNLRVYGTLQFGDASADTFTAYGAATFRNTLTSGLGEGAAYNVTLYGSTSERKVLWNAGSDQLIVSGTTRLQGNEQINGTVTVGSDSDGYDVMLYGDTSDKFVHWDEASDDLRVSGTTHLIGAFDVGKTGGGSQHDAIVYGSTDGKYLKFEQSGDRVDLQGALDVSGNARLDGSLNIGSDSVGYDLMVYGDTSDQFIHWDEASDDLRVSGTTHLIGALDVGKTGGGSQHNVSLYGSTDDAWFKWTDADDLLRVSAATRLFGTLSVGYGAAAGHNVRLLGTDSTNFTFWDAATDKLTVAGDVRASGATEIFGTTAIGVTGGGSQHDLTVYGSTNGKYFKWEQSGNRVDLQGGLNVAGEIILTGNEQLTGTLTVGADSDGYDVYLYGDTSDKFVHWDESADDLRISAATHLIGALDIGATGGGSQHDAIIYGSTNGKYFKWEASGDRIVLAGAVSQTGNLAVTGTTSFTGNEQLTGTLTVGADSDGYDVFLYGNTSDYFVHWDESADDLRISGTQTMIGNLTMTAANEIQFRNEASKIYSENDDALFVDASTKVHLASTCDKIYVGTSGTVASLYMFDPSDAIMRKCQIISNVWTVTAA